MDGKNGDLRFICATINNRDELLNSANQLSAARVSIIDALDNLTDELGSSTDEFFHLDNQHLRIDSVLNKLTSWIENAEQLSKWVAWQHRRNQANKLGLSEVVERLENGRLPLSTCFSSVEYTYYESLFSLMAKETPSLSRFDGDLHNRKVQHFSEMDLRRIKSSSIEVARAHHRRIPSKIGAAGPVECCALKWREKEAICPFAN